MICFMARNQVAFGQRIDWVGDRMGHCAEKAADGEQLSRWDSISCKQ